MMNMRKRARNKMMAIKTMKRKMDSSWLLLMHSRSMENNLPWKISLTTKR